MDILWNLWQVLAKLYQVPLSSHLHCGQVCERKHGGQARRVVLLNSYIFGILRYRYVTEAANKNLPKTYNFDIQIQFKQLKQLTNSYS
jgi:hypothetical protein